MALVTLESTLGDDVSEVRRVKEDYGVESTQNVDALFVDPVILASSPRTSFLDQPKRDSIPCVAFVELEAKNLHCVFNSADRGFISCFVYPMTLSESERLRHFVITLNARKLATRFLGALEASVGRLPRPLLDATLNLFERPSRYDCALDIALQANVARRSLYRNFDAVRVGSPRKLVVAAKIIHAYSYLRQQRLTVHQVAARVGYEKVETLVQHCQEILSCVPSDLRAESSEDEVLRQLFEWYCKPEIPGIGSDATEPTLLMRQTVA